MKTSVTLLAAGLLALLYAGSAHADVYIFVADDGSTHLSDNPDDDRYRLLYKEPVSQAPVAASNKASPYEKEIALAAQDSQIEPALLQAVIAVESNYNPRAISPKGARGLMQLMPATARAYGVRDAMEPLQNIRAGAKHLRSLLDRFANDKPLALAAYNAGLGAVLAYGGQIPPFAETRNYVPAVLQRYAEFKAR